LLLWLAAIRLLWVDDVDDDNGNLVGASLNPAGSDTVNYTTGAVAVNFAAAPASSILNILGVQKQTQVALTMLS
jgi:hypothetical protein